MVWRLSGVVLLAGSVFICQVHGADTLVVGNLVFRDLDDDGRFEPGDGESGIDGVLVNLYVDVDQNGVVELVDGPPIASTVTGGGGLYQFSGLAPGFYGVEVALSNFESGGPLEQWVSSTAKEWVPDDIDDDDNGFHVAGLGVSSSGVIELAVGLEPTGEDGDPNTNLTVDFGFRRALPPAIGNLVFRDLDDGRFEPGDGESGIDGVLINLYVDVDRNGVVESVDGAPIASTVTGGGGLYQFSGLAPGFYGVEVALSNFDSGGPLERWVSSTAKEWVPDDIDDDDNGFHVAGLGVSSFGGIELAGGLEPTGEDGDPNTNLTVDFGFVPTDSDGDGVRDPFDHCPDSEQSATVVIAGCETDVPNTLLANGCTIADLLIPCAATAKNHGEFVSCVAHLANELRQAGVISDQQKGRIQRCAAQANIP